MDRRMQPGLLLACVIAAALHGAGGQVARPMYGIPVPGQTLSAMEIFALHENSCAANAGKRGYAQAAADTAVSSAAGGGAGGLLGNSLKLLASSRGESLAQRAYASLFYAVGDVHVPALMGKWYRVASSPSVHPEKCVVEHFDAAGASAYTASFSTRAYSRRPGGDVQLVQGHGYTLGPDAGTLLIMTGHPADQCPVSVIKTGPIESDGRYAYVLLSPLLKFPVTALARDPHAFDTKYKDEVADFLRRQNFVNPLNPYNAVSYADWAGCPDEFYAHLDE